MNQDFDGQIIHAEFMVEDKHWPYIYETEPQFDRKRYAINIPAECIDASLVGGLYVNAERKTVRATSGRPPEVGPPPEGVEHLLAWLDEAKARNRRLSTVFIGRWVSVECYVYRPKRPPWAYDGPRPEYALGLDKVTFIDPPPAPAPF